MKKLITIILMAGLVSFAYGQEGNVFAKSYGAKNQQAPAAAEVDPGGGGDVGGGDPAPIDDYLPVLAAVGAGMAVYFGRKKLVLQKQVK